MTWFLNHFDAEGNGKVTQSGFENRQQANMAKRAESGSKIKNVF
jgi:hypothetical protein